MNDDELIKNFEAESPLPSVTTPEATNQTEVLRQVVRSKRFLAASRTGASIAEIATWNDHLVREFRLLVPIDLQALVVGEDDDAEPMVRLPMVLADSPTTPAGEHGTSLDNAMPKLFDQGTPRPAGVHLHWAMPDALLRGVLETQPDGKTNRLQLTPLPDRWVVLRLALEGSGARAVTRGWVLEADRAVAVDLDGWTEGGTDDDAPAAGVALTTDELTGTVGGSVNWAGTYDAVKNRFAFHDPLDDIDAGDIDGNAVAYLVAGWWSEPENDPLDAARTSASLEELLDGLRWRLNDEWGDTRAIQELNDSIEQLRRPLGLESQSRFTPKESDSGSFTPIEKTLTTSATFGSASKWATMAGEYLVTEPWHLRSSLLHGAVYGVPIAKVVGPDNKPTANAVKVAFGHHDGDVLAALSTVPGAPARRRRDSERLLQAFMAQRINRLGTPEGVVEIESEEHNAGFASQPGGIAGTDRFEQRAAPGQAGGTRYVAKAGEPRVEPQFPRPASSGASALAGTAIGSPEAVTLAANIEFAEAKYELQEGIDQYTLADRLLDKFGVGPNRTGYSRPATEPRVVDRPAPRFGFPAEPMLAVQGAGRSLRHANDGRASADGQLTCRWPAQVVSAVEGLIDGADLLASLDNGSLPPEVLSLAREVLIHDPYHLRWQAQHVTTDVSQLPAVERRLGAEAAVRFGVDAVYDGSTQAFASLDVDVPTRRGAAGRPGLPNSDLNFSEVKQDFVSANLQAFSMVKGADPDPVGVTCWSQPWVPLWLEWEVAVDLPVAPSLDGWELGSVDLEPTGAIPNGEAKPIRGRVPLTTGAATTLRRAVTDWLAAEDMRDATDPADGEADEPTEKALGRLARSVARADLVTAALDGFGRQLLGLAEGDAVRTPDDDGVLQYPAPVEEPTFMTGGRIRLKQARLVDAFGRILDLPVDDVQVTVRDSVDGDPGALADPPRLTRPARWRFRLVAASTPAGADGTEARVDQIDQTLQVNPVAGFILPDHLDESLELFDTAGNPLGELLTEAVGGGVTWEIAPGREGPPSSGPSFGLGPEQHTLGLFANGMIATDRRHRDGGPARGESALAAFLRAVDTTLWTVDTFAALGGEHVAGLVGRPIAVVRAQLRLELRPVDRVDLSDATRADQWTKAEEKLRAVPFPVRIGELTRLDDGVLGFFVDDDYSRVHLVDKAVAGLAAEGGRHRGQLGLLGSSVAAPSTKPILHPYVKGPPGTKLADSDTLHIHLGQTVTLTLLMHPGGVAHLTSGILPRFSAALARDWVAPGLGVIAPSLRTGPVLVETDLNDEGKVRVPKVSVFGTDQDFWWRDTPGSWRNDAILAATQTALLPDGPAELREGWIRVRPHQEDDS